MKIYKDKNTGTWIATYKQFTGIANNMPEAVRGCLQLINPNKRVR